MASKQGGGVGAFSWTLLGFLAGIAATLLVQKVLFEGGPDEADDTPSASSAVVVAPKLPPPTISHHHKKTHESELADAAAAAAGPDTGSAAPIEPSAAPKPKPKAVPGDAQVYDDAAAAGMTSRATSPNTP